MIHSRAVSLSDIICLYNYIALHFVQASSLQPVAQLQSMGMTFVRISPVSAVVSVCALSMMFSLTP